MLQRKDTVILESLLYANSGRCRRALRCESVFPNFFLNPCECVHWGLVLPGHCRCDRVRPELGNVLNAPHVYIVALAGI